MTLDGFINSYYCLALVWTTLLVSLAVSSHVLLQHLIHYNNHRLQLYVVRILVFMPIYGGLTFMLYLLPGMGDILEMLRNIWEGLLIHSFLCLMMEYCGGESQCGEVISRDPAVLRHIWPLRSIKAWSLNDDIPLNVGFVKRCRMGTMQYAFVRPILALLSVVFRLMGIEKLLIVAIFNWVVINASVYLALYALGLFYVATKKHPGLQKANCLTKCISLKLMVVFTFYQGCVLSWFTPLERGIADQLNTVLVLLELPIFAVLLQKAYDVEEFIPTKEELADPEAPAAAEPEKAPECQPQCIFDERLLKVCGAVGFNADDIREAGTPAGAEKILNSASKALNMKDLFNDIYHNISGKYREHAVLPQANTEANADEAPKKAPDAKAEAKAEVDFAEFEKEQSKQSLEEKAGTLSKLQFV